MVCATSGNKTFRPSGLNSTRLSRVCPSTGIEAYTNLDRRCAVPPRHRLLQLPREGQNIIFRKGLANQLQPHR